MIFRSTFILLFIAIISPHLAFAGNSKLCSDQTGKILVRGNCKSGETELTLSKILNNVVLEKQQLPANIGPAGPTGIVGLKGPKGPTGIEGNTGLTSIAHGPRGPLDFSGCREIISGPASGSGELTLAANCDSQNEFLFDDQWSLTGTPAFIMSNSRVNSTGTNGEILPYGTLITANIPNGGFYTLTVKAFCCPR